jgi:hypothetical protein
MAETAAFLDRIGAIVNAAVHRDMRAARLTAATAAACPAAFRQIPVQHQLAAMLAISEPIDGFRTDSKRTDAIALQSSYDLFG